MKTLTTMAEVVALVQAGRPVYVRYSRGPVVDARSGYRSTNHVSGSPEVGLSVANLTHDILPNGPDDIAERVYEYAYMLAQGVPGTRGWLLYGTESGRGADNEPLVTAVEPIAWLADSVIEEAQATWAARDAGRHAKAAAQRKPVGPIPQWNTPRVTVGK